MCNLNTKESLLEKAQSIEFDEQESAVLKEAIRDYLAQQPELYYGDLGTRLYEWQTHLP